MHKRLVAQSICLGALTAAAVFELGPAPSFAGPLTLGGVVGAVGVVLFRVLSPRLGWLVTALWVGFLSGFVIVDPLDRPVLPEMVLVAFSGALLCLALSLGLDHLVVRVRARKASS